MDDSLGVAGGHPLGDLENEWGYPSGDLLEIAFQLGENASVDVFHHQKGFSGALFPDG